MTGRGSLPNFMAPPANRLSAGSLGSYDEAQVKGRVTALTRVLNLLCYAPELAQPKTRWPLSGDTALHVAASCWHSQSSRSAGAACVPSIRLLLSRRASVTAVDHYGRTPLHDASESSSLEATRLLLHAGADAGAASRTGLTPAKIAVEQVVQHFLVVVPSVVLLVVGLRKTTARGATAPTVGLLMLGLPTGASSARRRRPPPSARRAWPSWLLIDELSEPCRLVAPCHVEFAS